METQIKPLPVIDMIPVESSQIAAIGHSPEHNLLAIQFPPYKRTPDQPGSLYHYENVTAEEFQQFLNAESIGSHFGKNIKPFTDRYPFVKIK